MNALEQQAQASESFWGTVAGVPREEPLSDAQVESAEMRSGTGTALQQTSFGRATDPAAPQLPEQEQRPLSDWEMEELEDQTVRDPSYIPTFNEWDSWDQKRAARSNAVNGFFQGAGSIASALGGVAWSLGKLPGDFVFRGFGPAYDTMVHSFAEGARRSGVGLAEIINYAGDVYADSRSDIRRSAAINDKIRKQLAAENKFTGNAQQDEAILEQAFHEARAAGLYDRTPEETAAQAQEDRKTAYDRFVRNRALEQEFLGIDNFTMGNDPIETGRIFGPKTVGGQPSQITAESVTKRAYGIDDSKVDEGLATFGMLALDPLAILPMGAGGLSKLRALRRISILADKPLGGVAKSAGWAATKAENLQDRLMSAGLTSDRLAKASFGVAIGSGALGFSQNNDVAKGIALAAAVLPAVRKSGGILRGVESAAQSGQMVVKEMGVGGVGVFRADSASRLADDAAIPGRYREAMRGFFSGPESSLKRASQNEGMSLRARRTLGALDNTGVTQAFRLADDAVSGGLAGAAVASPFALIAPEDQQSQIFGAIATMGAAGGLIGGPLARRTQMIDADIARMLADVDAAGGDAAYFSQLPHETLARYAAMQGVVSTKVDWVPLSAQDYAANLAMPAASRETTKGLFVDASDGNRPRIFLDIDQLASGDVAGHEIGHAILKSDILGGEIKNNMRNQVNVQYGQDGVQARGREYLARIMAREVEAGVTGIKPEVLTDAEMQRVANGASPEDIVRARWEDPQMRQRMIDERIEDKNQRDLAEGNMEWDWARDEIAAETFSGLSGGIDFRRMREGGPLAGMLGAASGLFDMMGAKFRGNGRLETPNRVFEENPLFDTPEMRRAVTNYTKQFERYLVGMERDSAPKKRGTKVAPTGKASEAARSPHNRVYQNGAVVENDIFILDANGNPMPKSQQQVNTQEKARAATLKSINTRTRLVPLHSAEWGARKVGTRVEVGGPNLPLQFDNFVQVPQWLRTKAREFEAGRRTGQSYRVSYNAIGTGASGSYKVSNLGNVEAITREVVPFGWQLSDKNHLLAKVIDLDAFRAAAIRAVDRGELPEFNNNVKDVEAGLKVLLKNHEGGLPGETNLGAQKKNLLNGLLGTGTPTQKAANPLYGDLNPKGSIRTFRFDRLNYADPFGTGYFPHYHKINTNALPREVGVMSLDEWRQFDADRKSAYLNQQAARRGYSNATNWQGADAAGFRAADAQYRREFPVPNERPTEGAALPREAQGMPDAAASGRGDGMADRKSLQQRAKDLGLPATGTTKEIARIVGIGEKNPYEWTREEFNEIAPHLSIHQDMRPGSDARVQQIMERGLQSGMVDSVGAWGRRHTWAGGKMTGDNAYLFISSKLKYRQGNLNPWLAEGNKPIAHIKTKPGQTDIYEALIASRPQDAPAAAPRGQAMPDVESADFAQPSITDGPLEIEDTPLRISTRTPSAKAATENPLTDQLSIDAAAIANAGALAKTTGVIAQYPGIRFASRGPEKRAQEFIRFAADNLLWLHDQVPSDIRPRSSLWYDGARNISVRWSGDYGVPRQGNAAAIAALSPQKDWYMNVSLARRVLEMVTRNQERVFGDAEMQWAKQRMKQAAPIQKMLAGLRGKRFADMTAYEKGVFTRAFDEINNPRGYEILSPEGEFIGPATNKDGSPSRVAWGDFNSIAKAVLVSEDPRAEVISRALGEEHKVRSFYNNIILPNYARFGDVTIDTHAVAAALLRPLAGSDTPVLHNFGGSGAGGSAITGHSGTYGLYADAYRLAASERGILPRQMQSITWEAVRGLFAAEWKTAANKALVDKVWMRYKKGEIDINETRKQISDSAGGIAPPSWY
jgi:hypothetical protein